MYKYTLRIAMLVILTPLLFTGNIKSQTLTNQIEEIIVTAQKTEQNLQDVPIAVSAFDSDAIALKQLDNFMDVQLAMPNVHFARSNFTGANFAIRGVQNLQTGASGSAKVALHVDQIPFGGLRIVEGEFFDIERIEVLRGPQGTLYGSTATGGVVNINFKQPVMGEIEGSGEISLGNYNHEVMKVALNIPMGDNVALRVSGMSQARDGFTTNNVTGNDIDGRNMDQFRAILKANLSEDTNITLTAFRLAENSTRARAGRTMCYATETPNWGCHPNKIGYDGSPLGASGLNGITLALSGLLGFSPLDYTKSSAEVGERTVNMWRDPTYITKEEGFALKLETKINDDYLVAVRAAKYTNFVMSQQDYSNSGTDTKLSPFNPAFPGGVTPLSDFTPEAGGIFNGGYYGDVDFPAAYDTSYLDSEGYYAEIQLVSDLDGPFNFQAGVNYGEGEAHTIYDVYFNGGDVASLFPALQGLRLWPGHFRNESKPAKTETIGIYIDGTYEVSEDVSISVGVRHNDVTKTVRDRSLLLNSIILAGGTAPNVPVFATVQTADPNLFGILTGQTGPAQNTLADFPALGEQRARYGLPTELTEEELTGRVVVNWTPDLEFTDSTLVYGSYSKGYGPGMFNPIVNPDQYPGVPTESDGEMIDAFEIGTKNILLDGTLLANLSAFHYEYDGMQTTKITNRTAVNVNLDAEMTGFEVELQWKVQSIPGLTVEFNGSVLDTKYANGTTDINPTNKGNNDPSLWQLRCIDSWGTMAFPKMGLLAGIGGGILNLDPTAGALDMIAAPKTLSVDGFTSADPSGTVNPLIQIGGMGALPTIGHCANIDGKLTAAGLMAEDGTLGISKPIDISGNPLPYSPEVSYSVALQYDTLINPGVVATARIDYYWQDNMWSRPYKGPRDGIDEYDNINASITFASVENGWYVRIWGQNLADDSNVIAHYHTENTSGMFRNEFLMDPQTAGITLGLQF